MDFENAKNNIEQEEEYLKMLSQLGIQHENIHGDVLDVGAGDAGFIDYIKQKSDAQFTAVDITISEETKDKVVQADVRKLPFNDKSFDLILSYASIPNIFVNLYSPDHPVESEEEIGNAVRKAFDEMIRVMKDRGKIILSRVQFAENYDAQKIVNRVIEANVERLVKEGFDVQFDFLETHFDPVDNESKDFYRLIIKK